MRSIVKLLRGTSDEEKFAGIMLSLKLIELGNLDQGDCKVILADLYKSISPAFVLKLMRMTEKRRLFRQTCISLIANSIQLGFSYIFWNDALKLIDILFSSFEFGGMVLPEEGGDLSTGSRNSSLNTEYDRTFELDLLLAMKWISADTSSANVFKLLSHTLKCTGGMISELPVYIYSALLDFLVDLCQLLRCPNTSGNSQTEKYALTAKEAAQLRKLIIKGFHGGAPESVRDSSLFCCLHFLSLNSSVHPSWSVEILDETQSDTGPEKGDRKGSGKFAMLLVSVIGIEVHLLLEEALALFKNPEGEPMEPIYGDLRDPVEDRRKKYNEVGTEACINNTSVRVERISNMIPCCMSLLSAILELLIGNNKTESDDTEVTASLHWTGLPSPAMLHIRQTVHNIFQKIFDFLKEISDVSQSSLSHVFTNSNRRNESDDALSLTNGHDTLLLRIIQQATATLCLWVLEDEDLRDPFLVNLPFILRWSVVTVYFDESDSQTREIISSYGVDWRATPVECWKSIIAGPSRNVVTGGNYDVGDVIHHIVPCLAAVSCSLTAKDEYSEKICTVDRGSLFARLINIAVLVGMNALSLREQDMNFSTAEHTNGYSASSQQNNLLHKTDDNISFSGKLSARNIQTSCSALNLLTNFFSWKQCEIQTLMKSETESEALTDVFSILKDLFPKIRTENCFVLSLTIKGNQEKCLTSDLADILEHAHNALHTNIELNESVSNEILTLILAMHELITLLRIFSST